MAVPSVNENSRYIMTVDPSSSHLAYVIGEVGDDSLTIVAYGMLWTDKHWNRGQRFS
jgi:hypothetical protein